MQLLAYYILKGHDIKNLMNLDYAEKMLYRCAMELEFEQNEIPRG